MSWFRLKSANSSEASVEATTELFSTVGNYGLETLSDAENARTEFVRC